ncbi:MAG: hypothetical protein HY841_15325 [Bacteroidetes bacterium]|nr:hypothetical protein [Bacteroidota bacterium]
MEREHLIKEIQDLAERIRTNTSDADSLLTDVSHLYEMVILLKHLPEEVKTNGEIKETKEVVVAEDKTEKENTEPLDLFSSTLPAEPEKIETAPPAPKIETPKVTTAKKKIDESVVEKLQHNKITDLKSVIGINEKFQFINELFDGNMKEYTVAVDQINSFSSNTEAEFYIANLKEIYKWKPDNHIADNFKELVERRFA